MTTSTLELGPEILERFVPTEHLLDGNQGIATIPDYPDYLLRWWPRHRGEVKSLNSDVTAPLDETALCLQPQALANIFERADVHFAQLEEHGIKTLQPGLDIIRFTGDGNYVGLEGIVQFSIVKWLDGPTLDPYDPRGIPLVRGYAQYLQYAASTGEVLWDVPKAEQHIIDKIGIMTLADSEPLVAPVDTPVVGRDSHRHETAMEHAASHLYVWGGKVGLRGADMDAVHDLAFS